MFTGIIEELGVIKKIVKKTKGIEVTIGCKTVLEDAQLGDSIATMGVCLTVKRKEKNAFLADIMEDTVRTSVLKNMKEGDEVNLERALKFSSRLGGHFVTGHVDATALFKSLVDSGDAKRLTFYLNQEIEPYLILKGSVAINGVSLTIQELTKESFTVSVIPHTYRHTQLKDLKRGDPVNIECDFILKSVNRLLQFQHQVHKPQASCSEAFLKENGWI